MPNRLISPAKLDDKKAVSLKENILIITFDPPQNVGGIEGRGNNYTRELKQLGYFVEIISLFPDQKEFQRDQLWGAPFLQFPSSPTRIFGAFRRTRREINDNSINSIYLLSGALTLYGLLILIYARMRSIHSLIFFYGKDILHSKNSFFGP